VAHCKIYTNVPVSQAGGAAVAGPSTIAQAAACVVAGIPVKGAFAVVLRMKASNNNPVVTPGFNVGNSPVRTELWLASTGIGYQAPLGNVAVRYDQTGGNTLILERTPAGSRALFYHDFGQFTFAGPTAGTATAFTVDVEVWYDHDGVQSQNALGFGAFVPQAA
jgi:hypothetical protein